MQKKSRKVGIIIVTHNGYRHIASCLQSVVGLKYKNKEILLIDNASDSRTRNLIERFKKHITIIRNKENSTYASSNNQGINALLKKGCGYFILLNDDTVVKNNLIEKLLHGFEVSPDIGITGCNISYFDNPDIIWYGGGYFNKTFCFTRHVNMGKPLAKATGGYTDYVTGCCMMINRKTVETTGLLDVRNGFYFEDSFYCLTALGKGIRSYVVKDCLVKHRVSSSTGKSGSNLLTPFKAYYYARNPFIYIKSQTAPVIITQIFGQVFVRMAYYIALSIGNGMPYSIPPYIKGFIHGVTYLRSGVLAQKGFNQTSNFRLNSSRMSSIRRKSETRK